MNPFGTLVVLGVLCGVAVRWVPGRIADYAAMGVAVRRIQAHLLEFWIFVDEPSVIWKSWKGLLRANARLLGLLLPPLVILSIPALPLLVALDALYGTAPLPVGKPALVTLGFSRRIEASLQLQAPDGIVVESPAVRVFSERQVSWRIRPLRPLSAELRCVAGDSALTKTVVAAAGFAWHSRRRTRSLLQFLGSPTEPLLPSGPVNWIEISYPAAGLSFFGIEAHWSIWFFACSLLGAFAGAPRRARLRAKNVSQ